MKLTAIFCVDAATIAATEKYREDRELGLKRERNKGVRGPLFGVLFALVYVLPAVIFFSSQSEPIVWLVAYLVAAPWVVILCIYGWSLQRRAKEGASVPREYELELSETALSIHLGKMSFEIRTGGMKVVDRLQGHIAMVFENSSVFLLPLRALECEQRIQRWIESLQRLCEGEDRSNKTIEPTR